MMDATMLAGMREATRLTRAGQLDEAVALIQRTLRGARDPQPAHHPRDSAPHMTLEGQCRVVEDEPFSQAACARATQAGASGEGAAEGNPEPAAASDARTPSPTRFGAGLHEEWTARLRERLGSWRGPTAWSDTVPDRSPEVVPEGARFIHGAYTNHAGTRSYKLYIPSGYRGQPVPLVVMLHGCTQDPDDFSAGTRMNELAEEQVFLVAYPAQSPAANQSKCWNWFQAGDQQRDRGEPSIIAGLTRQIVANHSVDARRIYVAGLSAGGAMAVTLGMTYPDLYAAVGVHSGLPHGVAQDLPSAFAAMRSGKGDGTRRCRGGTAGVPAIVFHGDRDTTVHPCNGDEVIAQCAPTHAGREATPADGRTPRVSVERGQVPQGHAYTRTIYHDSEGNPLVEQWLVHGAGHAWSGGSPRGSYTDPKGPDATLEMLRFFDQHPQGERAARVS